MKYARFQISKSLFEKREKSVALLEDHGGTVYAPKSKIIDIKEVNVGAVVPHISFLVPCWVFCKSDYKPWDFEGFGYMGIEEVKKENEMLTTELVQKALERTGFKETTIICPDGARAEIAPCGCGVLRKIEDCEYFLIYWDIPWGGEDNLEDLVKVLNNHEVLAKQQEDDKAKIKAYFEEHQKNGWTEDDWDWYSDWHKDVFGYRPHGMVCGEYIRPW